MKNPSQYQIQKRKDGRYVVAVMFNKKRHTIYGKTKKEAREKLTKLFNEIQNAKVRQVFGRKHHNANDPSKSFRLLVCSCVFTRLQC